MTGAATPRVALPACGLPAAAEITCTVPAAGFQSMLITGARAGGYTLTVQRLNDPAGCSTMSYGPTTRTGAIVSGETECWRFTGAAGHRVRLRLVTRGATRVMRLDDRLRVSASPALYGDLKHLLGPGCLG